MKLLIIKMNNDAVPYPNGTVVNLTAGSETSSGMVIAAVDYQEDAPVLPPHTHTVAAQVVGETGPATP